MSEPMGRIRHIHMVGIGGSGMNGIAEVLLNLGYVVSGSDLRDSATVARLRASGAEISIGHRTENLTDADVVVTSSAIQSDNPEVAAALKRRIPVIPRAEMLAELMRFRYGIAVAGTHGKTTTTSLIASVLIEAGLDPTFVIGGRLESAGSSARLGQGRYLVAEADESDASFLLYKPMMSVVTNIDRDHLGTYGDDFSRLESSFIEFLHQLPFYGRAILCADDPVLARHAATLGRAVWTYGFGEADFQATDIRAEGQSMHFKVSRPDADALALSLNLPGRHNVLNALAAVAAAQELGVADAALTRALAEFHGIGRRMQILGELAFGPARAQLIDDYGHHPREVAATLAAVREAWPERRLIVVFQPHRYSRTHDLLDDFGAALANTDVLLLGEVYAAGEKPIAGADARAVARAIRSRGRVEPVLVSDLAELPAVLDDLVKDGDIVLTLGAGDVGQHSRALFEARGVKS
ncbi:MAG TPA: UDP-N-acetylmuramate--L-alanine ligase [Gammaproteobacteria bacterium]|nr:UDP-N-acetylmuramate--L-alanine ligase [Gammaproteobacteria bacterium]